MNEEIKKIAELVIEIEDHDDELFDEYGVEVVSLVEEPAIGVDFMAFSDAGASEEVDVELESYTDYPDSASNNAKRALEWAEENGWGDCGTDVGKRRANQLAKKQPISRDTIARMASFKRHQQHKDVPYSEGCGGLMWDAWGGTSGIEWAINKMEEFEGCETELHFSEEAEDALIDYATNNGEEITPDDLIVDLNNKEFSTIKDVVTAIQSLDILRRLNIKREEPAEEYWRYSGPPAQRKFCRAMMNLSKAGKIFSKKDIQKMDGINSQFAKKGQSSYSIFKYKGGKNCKHYWEKLKVFKNEDGRKVIIVAQPTKKTERTAATQWQNMQFSLDEEKRIVTGPLMIPNKMIIRKDEENDPYYVYFSKKTIRKMAEKFLKVSNHNKTDVNHDWNVMEDNTLIESWISESMTHDKSHKYGYTLPVGTWFVSYKINNDSVWERIKAGEIKGFSLAGPFIENITKAKREEQTLQKIKNILKNVSE